MSSIKKILTLTILSSVFIGTVGQAETLRKKTAEVKVTGQIVPGSCTLSVGGGGIATFAYGDISTTMLSDTGYTKLPKKSLPLLVDCTAKTYVLLSAVDNRKTQNPFSGGVLEIGHKNLDATDIGGPSNFDGTYSYGLGGAFSPRESMTGAYILALDAGVMQQDGASVKSVYSTNGDDKDLNKRSYAQGYEAYLGAGSNGALTYKRTWGYDGLLGTAFIFPGQHFSTNLMVQAFINEKSGLDLSKPLVLDGSASLELFYL